MDLDIDSSTILYAVGALFGVVTVLYFSREIILNLSPTIKSMLLLGGFAVFLSAGMYMRSAVLQKTLYVLSSVSYLAFLVYTIGKFGFTTEQVFLSLGVSSVLFITLGYLIREKDAGMAQDTAKKIVVGLIAAGLILVAVDVAGPQPTYEVSFVNEVEADSSGQVTIGTLTVQNEFIFSRDVDQPQYRACLYIPDRRPTHVSESEEPSTLSGQSTETVDLTVSIPMKRVNDTRVEPGLGTIPVEEMEDCPETSEEPRLVVAENTDGRETIYRD